MASLNDEPAPGGLHPEVPEGGGLLLLALRGQQPRGGPLRPRCPSVLLSVLLSVRLSVLLSVRLSTLMSTVLPPELEFPPGCNGFLSSSSYRPGLPGLRCATPTAAPSLHHLASEDGSLVGREEEERSSQPSRSPFYWQVTRLPGQYCTMTLVKNYRFIFYLINQFKFVF